MACELPAASNTPLARWSCPDLALEAIRPAWSSSVSASTVRRWLAADAIKPWQHRSWIFPRDPDFGSRPAGCWTCTPDRSTANPSATTSTSSLPTRNPASRPATASTPATRPGPAGTDAGRNRVPAARHPGLPRRLRRAPRPGDRPLRPDHRHRTLHRAGHQSDDQQPYASARRVFWIVDNGSSHRGWTAAAPLSEAFPNAIMVHTPVHASWLNQVEIYFSVVQRKLLTPDNIAGLDGSSNSSPPSRLATTKPPNHSTGDSTVTTSRNSSTGSPPNPPTN